MLLGQFKIFLCRHWCKRPLVKNTKTYNITFQNYRLENKLPKKLGDEMFIIISNSVLFNQKSVLLLNSSWRIIGNWNLLPPLYRNPLLFTIYINIKPGLNSSLIQVVTGYHVKLSFRFSVYITITISLSWATWNFREYKILHIDVILFLVY